MIVWIWSEILCLIPFLIILLVWCLFEIRQTGKIRKEMEYNEEMCKQIYEEMLKDAAPDNTGVLQKTTLEKKIQIIQAGREYWKMEEQKSKNAGIWIPDNQLNNRKKFRRSETRMYTKYDIIDLFGSKYWTYNSPEGGLPSVILHCKLREDNLTHLKITHNPSDAPTSTLELHFIEKVEFEEQGDGQLLMRFYDNLGVNGRRCVAHYLINLNKLEYEGFKVSLIYDGNTLESRILTEPKQIYEKSEERR